MRGQCPLTDDCVGHGPIGIGHRAIIACNGLVEGGACPAITPLQFSTSEDRQADRPTGIAVGRAALEQIIKPQRLIAEDAAQAERRIEIGARHLDAARLGFHPRPRRGDIGSATDQIGRDTLRNATRDDRNGRCSNRQATIRPGAKQRCQTIAGQRNLLVCRGQIAARRWHGSIGLLELRLHIETASDAIADQRCRLLAHVQRRFLHRSRREQTGKIGIGIRYAGREQQGGLCLIEPRRFKIGLRRCIGRAIAAPQVEIEAQRAMDIAGIVPTLGHEGWRDAIIIALLGKAAVSRGIQRRQARSTRLLQHAFRTAHARDGRGDIRRSLERFGNQAIKLRIAISVPPAITGPGRRSRTSEALLCGIVINRLDRRGWAEFRHGSAGGQAQQSQHAGRMFQDRRSMYHILKTVLRGTVSQMRSRLGVVNRKLYRIVQLWRVSKTKCPSRAERAGNRIADRPLSRPPAPPSLSKAMPGRR